MSPSPPSFVPRDLGIHSAHGSTQGSKTEHGIPSFGANLAWNSPTAAAAAATTKPVSCCFTTVKVVWFFSSPWQFSPPNPWKKSSSSSSAQVGRSIIWPPGLDDFGFGFLGLLFHVVLLVTLTDVDDDAGSGGSGCMELVFLSWSQLGNSI